MPSPDAWRAAVRPAARALVEDLLDPAGHGLDPGCLDGAVEDLLRRLELMPRWLGPGLAGLTVVFDLLGGPHHRLPRARRVARTERWRHAPGPLRNLVDFYEKMGTFTYYSRLEHR